MKTKGIRGKQSKPGNVFSVSLAFIPFMHIATCVESRMLPPQFSVPRIECSLGGQ